MGESLCSHFNIEGGEICNIFSVLCFIISRKVKTPLKCKERFVQCMQKVLRLIECIKSGLQSFPVLLTFQPNNSLLWGCLCTGRCLAADTHQKPTAGDSQYTENIQLNKVIGESENCVFYIMDKTNQAFWPAQYIVRIPPGPLLTCL